MTRPCVHRYHLPRSSPEAVSPRRPQRVPSAIGRPLLGVAVAVLLPAAPAAAAGWLPATTVSAPGEDAQSAQIAVAPDGTATAVWFRPGESSARILAATRRPGDPWDAPLTLSSPGIGPYDPRVVVDADGNATVVSFGDDAGDLAVFGTARSADGSWLREDRLSASGQDALDPRVAVAADGTVTGAWIRSDGANWRVQVASRAPGSGGTWGLAATLSTAGEDAATPELAAAADGAVTVVWSSLSGVHYRVFAATRPAGGSWSAPQALSDDGQDAASPQVAVAADGTATVVWRRSDGSHDLVETVSRPVGGGWSAAETLSAPGESGLNPQVAVAADGSAIVVWDRFDGSHDRVQASQRPAGGAWSAPETISDAGQSASTPQVVIAADGTATAAWRRSDGTDERIQAASQPPGAAWTTPRTLSDAGQSAFVPLLAAAPSGDVTAVWRRFDGSHDRVEATVLDVTPPLLDDLTLPTTATVGVPVRLAVAPRDTWSPLAPTTWDTGDGTAVEGDVATHVYAAPGNYAVTVTAADVHGNVVSETRTITVANAPLPDPIPPSGPVLPAPPAASRSGRFLTVPGLVPRGRSVRLTAVAPALAGASLSVLRDGRAVADGRVASDGTISVTAPAPRSPADRARARYRLVSGTVRSGDHVATRQALIADRSTQADGRFRVRGRIAGIGRPTRLTLTGRPACGTTRPTTIRVRTDRRGRFAVTLPAPPADVPAVTYRIRYGTRTVTLPTTIARR